MVSSHELTTWALALPEVVEQPHFEKTSFRVSKKIFATLDVKTKKAVLKLSAIDQSVFSDYNNNIIYPVPGGWGKQGWTIFELPKLRKSLLKDALTTAYCTVAPKKLAEKVRPTR
jgi:predicted DNA-binding protein (MmcQ/YjbR family)